MPKDMGFLRKVFVSSLLEGAEESDQQYRQRIVDQIGEGKKILMKGISYKQGVRDLKYSRGIDLIRELEKNGNKVWVKDPLYTSEELEKFGLNAWKTEQGLNELIALPDLILERNNPLSPEMME